MGAEEGMESYRGWHSQSLSLRLSQLYRLAREYRIWQEGVTQDGKEGEWRGAGLLLRVNSMTACLSPRIKASL